MNRRSFLKTTAAGAFAAGLATQGFAAVNAPKKPKNIILILADDVGWGDVSCYGPTPGLTPAVDKLASEGIRFTDAHSPASTCTPTRFALMTGEYGWRKPGRGILAGDAALIIPTDIETLPKLMKKAGCVTGAVGKWHLGIGPGPFKTDWNKEVAPGPREIGFDYSFIMPATGDRTPCVYMENQLVVGLDPDDPIKVNYSGNYPGEPDGVRDRASLKMNWSHGHNQAVVNGIGRIGYMKGGQKARWKDEDMADTFAAKAVSFIERNKNNPFFLYFATHDIHVPRVPHPRFAGTTSMGPRGDAIRQWDWQVEEVVKTIDRLGLAEETLIVVTSDNGPAIDDGYQDQAVKLMGSHKPAGHWRGGKYVPYEGGHRLPFIARWKGQVKPGTSDAMISLIDLPSSFAAMKGVPLAPAALPDSLNMAAALLDASAPGRTELITQDNRLTIRDNEWKYIVPPPQGNAPKVDGNALNGELYALTCDPSEKLNVAKENPERAKAMYDKLLKAVKDGRTRPL